MRQPFTFIESDFNVVRKQLVKHVEESGLSVKAICEAAAIDASNIRNYLRANSTTRIDSLERICETLGLDITITKRGENA